VFEGAIDHQYPLTERDRLGLLRLQQLLSLRDEDVAEIEAPLLVPKQTEYEHKQVEQEHQVQELAQLREQAVIKQPQQSETVKQRQTKPNETPPPPQESVSANNTKIAINRRQLLKWGGFGGGGLAVALIGNQIFQRQQLWPAVPKITAPDPGSAKVNGLPLWTAEFETVLVDELGQVNHRPSHQAKFVKVPLGNGIELELVSLAAGSFLMGSPRIEAKSSDDERPQHLITLKSFLIGKYPVTQAQWKAVASFPKIKIDLNPDPSQFKGKNLPVETVSWDEAVEFCARLSKTQGQVYRLPSEAEWEYACRGGTKTPFHFGETITPELANYDSTSVYGQGPKGEYRKRTTEVGSFKVANAYGLYDLHGNVWEWCQDYWQWHDSYKGSPTDGSAWIIGGDASKRVMRGGSWNDDPGFCRSAYRSNGTPSYRDINFGFRVVSEAPRTS
jgi:formylglycine-generating enzyme required for sulfatase activity